MPKLRLHILFPLIGLLLTAPMAFLMTAAVCDEEHSLAGLGFRRVREYFIQNTYWPTPPGPRVHHTTEFIQVGDRFVPWGDVTSPVSLHGSNWHTVQMLDGDRDSTGLWFPIIHIEEWQIVYKGPPLAPRDLQLLRNAYINHLIARDPVVARNAATFRKGDYSDTSILRNNVMLNAVSLFAIAGCFASLALLVQRLRHYWRFRSNLCPHCRYDRSGLILDAPCPECGKTAQIAA